MAACQNSKWIINLWKLEIPSGTTAPPFPLPLLETLFFDLTIDPTTKVISGDVFLGNIRLSAVMGNCAPNATPDGNLLGLSFNWGSVDVYIAGFTHTQVFVKFKGVYRAQTRDGAIPDSFDQRLKAFAPGDGETGTSTGQQT
jgi:hypothetical protein